MARLLVAVLLVLPSALLADAPRPAIEQLMATAAGGKVSVRFALSGAFADEEVIEALRSGLPTTFAYSIEVFRDRPNWFDDGISRVRIEAICTYNSLTREYLLNYRRERRLVRSETFTDLAALQRAMTSIDEVDLFEIGRRKPYKLRVRARATLARGWFLWVIPSEVGTRWREVRVRAVEPVR